jgi:hypothetical protein
VLYDGEMMTRTACLTLTHSVHWVKSDIRHWLCPSPNWTHLVTRRAKLPSPIVPRGTHSTVSRNSIFLLRIYLRSKPDSDSTLSNAACVIEAVVDLPAWGCRAEAFSDFSRQPVGDQISTDDQMLPGGTLRRYGEHRLLHGRE